MSTCIRDCDQQYMSAACAADVNCACADTTVLQHVYQCVQTTCNAQAKPLTDSVRSACGAEVALAMVEPITASQSSRASTQIPSRTSAAPSASSSSSAAAEPSQPSPSSIFSPSSPEAVLSSSGRIPQASSPAQDFTQPSQATRQSSSWTPQRSQPARLQESQDWLGGAQNATSRAETKSLQDVPQGRASSADPASSASSPAQSSLGLDSAAIDGVKDGQSEERDVPSGASGLEGGTLAGSVAGAVAAILLISLLVWLCLRARKRNNKLEGRSRVTYPSKEYRSSFGENTGTMPWTGFEPTSPEPEEMEFSEKQMKSEHHDGPAIQVVPRIRNHGREVSPTRTRYTSWHRAVPVPPPSMRSKRTSALTNVTSTTDAQTVETGIHTLDSTTQLAYPVQRPVSSLSFGFESPKKGPSTRASWSTQGAFKVPETPPDASSDGHELITPSISRTSTMTDVSLGAVGRRSRYMGRAL